MQEGIGLYYGKVEKKKGAKKRKIHTMICAERRRF